MVGKYGGGFSFGLVSVLTFPIFNFSKVLNFGKVKFYFCCFSEKQTFGESSIAAMDWIKFGN
jgi:hypothetical protein